MTKLLPWLIIVGVIVLIAFARDASRRRMRRRRRCSACRQEKLIRVGQWRGPGRGYRRLSRGELYQLKRRPAPVHTCRLNRKELRTRARLLSRLYGHQRRALLAGSRGSYTPAEWTELLARYDKCPGCNRLWRDISPPPGWGSPITVDHIVPLALGGRNDIFNIQPLCYSCNSRKGTKLIEYPVESGGAVHFVTNALADAPETSDMGAKTGVADPPFFFSTPWSEISTTGRDGSSLLGRGYDVRLGRRGKDARFALVTKVAGVTYQNPGIRASVFAVGKAVQVRADTHNAFDAHAVGVWDGSGRVQAGYLPKAIALRVARYLARGTTLYGLAVWEWVEPGGQRVGLIVLLCDGPPVPR